MDRKPDRKNNNGEWPHVIYTRPESWSRRHLRGATGISCGLAVESITFLQPPEKFNEAVLEHLAAKMKSGGQ